MITANVSKIDTTQEGIIVEGTLVPSGNYATGGDTVDFSALSLPTNANARGLIEVAEQPANGTTPKGYMFWMIAGKTLKDWLLWIATAAGQPPTELAAGAYPDGLTGSTIQFRAFFSFSL